MTGAEEVGERPATGFVAPKQHTAILLLILMVLALSAVLLPRFFPKTRLEHAGRLSIYLQILLTQAALFLYVHAGIRRAGRSVRQLLTTHPCTLRAAPFTWELASRRLCSG